MKIKRIIINLLLLAGLLLAIYVLSITITEKEWNTVAASLAVITAIIGSWSAERIIWKQEDELEPKLDLYLDSKSRVSLTQFVVENVGGSTAYDIRIKWTIPLIDHEDKEVHFSSGENEIDIKRITKGQKHNCLVNGTSRLFSYYDKQNKALEFKGVVEFKKSPKSILKRKEPFYLTLEPFRKSIETETESQEFYHQASKLHQDLKEINNTLKKTQKQSGEEK